MTKLVVNCSIFIHSVCSIISSCNARIKPGSQTHLPLMVHNQNYPCKIIISSINDTVLVQKLSLEAELTFLYATGSVGKVWTTIQSQHQHALQRDSDSCTARLCYVTMIVPFMFINTLTQKHLKTHVCTYILASIFQHSETEGILSCMKIIFCQI